MSLYLQLPIVCRLSWTLIKLYVIQLLLGYEANLFISALSQMVLDAGRIVSEVLRLNGG